MELDCVAGTGALNSISERAWVAVCLCTGLGGSVSSEKARAGKVWQEFPSVAVEQMPYLVT